MGNITCRINQGRHFRSVYAMQLVLHSVPCSLTSQTPDQILTRPSSKHYISNKPYLFTGILMMKQAANVQQFQCQVSTDSFEYFSFEFL